MRRRCSHSRKVQQQRRRWQATRLEDPLGPIYRRPTAIWMRLSNVKITPRAKMAAHKEIDPALQISTLLMVQPCLCRSAAHSLHGYSGLTLTNCAPALHANVLLLKQIWKSRPKCLWLIAVSLQAGRAPIQSQASGADVWSRHVPENAWGEALAVSGPAALPDAAHQRPLKEPSIITSVQAQVPAG